MTMVATVMFVTIPTDSQGGFFVMKTPTNYTIALDYTHIKYMVKIDQSKHPMLADLFDRSPPKPPKI